MRVFLLSFLCLCGCKTQVEPWHYATPAEIQASSERIDAIRAQIAGRIVPSMPPMPALPVWRKAVGHSVSPPPNFNPWSGAFTQTITTDTNKGVTRIWLARTATNLPAIIWPARPKAQRMATAPPCFCGVIRLLPFDPLNPARWVQADWTGTPYGNLDIQMAEKPFGPWTTWASLNANQWVYDPYGVLQVGWQFTDDYGTPYKCMEYMRLQVTPP